MVTALSNTSTQEEDTLNYRVRSCQEKPKARSRAQRYSSRLACIGPWVQSQYSKENGGLRNKIKNICVT